jgi:hypothetical protein
MNNAQLPQYQKDYTNFMTQSQQLQAQNRGQSIDQMSKGNWVAGDYGSNVSASLDPQAVARARGVQEKGISDYSGMVSGLYSNPGYSADEKAGMRAAVTQPVSAAYGAAAAESARQGAATGNAGAGMANAQDLARQKSMALTQGLSGLQNTFANARRQDTDTAISAQGAIPGMAAQEVTGQQAQNAQLVPQFNAYYGAGLGLGSQALQGSGQQESALGTQGQIGSQLQQQPGFWSRLAVAGLGAAGAALSGRKGGGGS